MVGRTLVCFAVLCIAAEVAIAQAPALHLEYINQKQKETSQVGLLPIRVPSTDRIRLIVVLEPLPPGADRAGGERLEVRAENQAPGYFENRPPANISFVVRSMNQQVSREVPFKVYSSGGGLDPKRLFLYVDLDIVVDATVRHAKFRELAARVIAAARQEKPVNPNLSHLVDGPEGVDRLTRYFEMSGAVYIPPGEYEITAVHRAKDGAILTSEPGRFVVFEAEYPIPTGPGREQPK